MNGRAANVAGGALLDPWVIASMAILFINDHIFKHIQPSWVTGKLSDFAGLVFFPLLLQGCAEVVQKVLFGVHVPSRKVLLVCVGLTGMIFSVTELSAWGAEAYVRALDWGLGTPHRTWADPTDLLALPMLFVSYRLGRRRLMLLGRATLDAKQEPDGPSFYKAAPK
ncbi:MAG: hypothetical protein SFV15_05100 [Polyangiaceae bacterium]|nr:hypothetical protein [Polyangiaceae bacterium]